MPTNADISVPARRFRRAATIGAALSLALFLWTIWMLVHFNNGTVSVRFGGSTMVNIASIVLPGPVLLAFLAWNARYPFCRVLGWVALLPVVALAAVPAVLSTLWLRPPILCADYDAAAKEAETAALAAVNADATALKDGKAVRERLNQRPTDRDELADMARRIRHDAEVEHASAAACAHLFETLTAPFAARNVSAGRAETFARACLGRNTPAEIVRTSSILADSYQSTADRLDLLVRQHGKWRWKDDGDILFEDDAASKAYNALFKSIDGPAH